MKKRYAVIAGAAIAIPCGSVLAQSHKDARASASAAWATMDANTDGALSPDEVAGTPWAKGFDRMDGNNDGHVTRQEYNKYTRARKQAHKDKQDKES